MSVKFGGRTHRLCAFLKRPPVGRNMARPSSGTLRGDGNRYKFWMQNKWSFLPSLCLVVVVVVVGWMMTLCVMTDLAEFRRIFSRARSIAILTGAGVSAESGVPTFRGAGGYWRKWQAQVPLLLTICCQWMELGEAAHHYVPIQNKKCFGWGEFSSRGECCLCFPHVSTSDSFFYLSIDSTKRLLKISQNFIKSHNTIINTGWSVDESSSTMLL